MQKYIFKSKLHTFQAIVNRNNNTIIIGGRYNDCIDIAFDIKNNIAYIDHIQSEPECTLDSNLENGEAVDMIRASIQFIHTIYPNIINVEFDDASKIDCGKKSKLGRPPRKFKKPLSLPHLSIATNKQTWYEKYFKATYKNEHAIYRKKIEKLDEPIKYSFDEFIKLYGLDSEQVQILQPKYITASSWYDLFSNIPKEDRCKVFNPWLEFFIQSITEHAFSPATWVINIDTMPKTEMTILASGGKIKYKRYTRKNTYKPKFSHNSGHSIM